MPTGYTSVISEGITFEKFVLRCARNFGALIMMRDEPMDAPIPDKFAPDRYHLDQLELAVKRLEQLTSEPDELLQLALDVEFQEKISRHKISIEKNAELKRQYESMLDKVKAWVPPTSDHNGLKDFMVQQITDSIKFDCSEITVEEPKKQSLDEWKHDKIQQVKREIEYHTDRNKKEIQSANARTIWVQALKKSL